jgi:hypothetical protein
MRSIDMIDAGIALASTIHDKICYFFRYQINVFYINSESLKLAHTNQLLSSCEEFYQPAVYEAARLISHYIWILSFEVEVVPEFEVDIAFVSLGELL